MKTSGVPAAGRSPMRADARRNRERLLAEARTAFAEKGTEASLEDIARRADVAIGTLYRHFPTRQALLEALLRDSIDGLCTTAEELLASSDPAEALAAWIRAGVVHATTYGGLAASLMSGIRDEESELHAACHAMRSAGAALLSRAQEAGAARPDVDATDVFALVGAVAWAGEQLGGGADRTDRLSAIALDGLLATG